MHRTGRLFLNIFQPLAVLFIVTFGVAIGLHVRDGIISHPEIPITEMIGLALGIYLTKPYFYVPLLVIPVGLFLGYALVKTANEEKSKQD